MNTNSAMISVLLMVALAVLLAVHAIDQDSKSVFECYRNGGHIFIDPPARKECIYDEK